MTVNTLRSDAVFDGQQQSNPQVLYAALSLAASGDLIAAVPGLRIRVLGAFLVAAGAVTVQFQTGGATNLTGAISLATGTPLVLPDSPHGYFQTAAGQKLNLVLGTAVQVSGGIIYVTV